MALALSEIKTRIKESNKKGIINKAIRHENRLKFHTETHLDQSLINQPVTDFLDWVKTLIPKDKFNIFASLFKFPTPMVDLSNKVYNNLEKVFDGRDGSTIFRFKDSDLNADWDFYRKNVLKEPIVWREKGWQVMQTAINSIVIVDLPLEQVGERPEPYFYFLPISRVIDYSHDCNGNFEYVIFKGKESTNKDERIFHLYDDEKYVVFKTIGPKESVEIISENAHDLGFCPAKWFWKESVASEQKDLKKAPITPQLTNYDWTLFFSISKRALDLYAPYPIYSAYEADCDFINNETGEYCDGGYLRDEDDKYVISGNGVLLNCPRCGDKRIVGAGSFIDVPKPQNGEVDMKDPVSITTIDGTSLEYNTNEVNRLKKEIFVGVVGSDGDVQQKEAINETQVKANYEDRTTILNNLKINFELIMAFVDDTICRLRYGNDYIGSAINLGTEFYIYNVDELYDQFDKAKKNGASESKLNDISLRIIQTEYRNNPSELQRMLLLHELEPYKNYTRDELNSLSPNLINDSLRDIKINFTSFVERFERENTDIVEFGSLMEYDKKIKTIYNEFLKYAKEEKNNTGSSSGKEE